MKHHLTASKTPLPIYTEWVADIKATLEIEFPTEYVVLFWAADFRLIAGSEIVDLAKSLLFKGIHYVCCWGPECEKAHDCFDEAKVILEIDNGFERHVMTTWHSDESLDEALWFCIYNATPEDEFGINAQLLWWAWAS